jgi:hypothetical protein
LQVSWRNIAFLRGVELLEELVEPEGDVIGLLLLLVDCNIQYWRP